MVNYLVHLKKKKKVFNGFSLALEVIKCLRLIFCFDLQKINSLVLKV